MARHHGGGLNCYDPQTGLFTDYRHDPANPASLSENCVTCVEVDRRGQVWAGTSNNGLNVLDPQSGLVTRYLHDPANPHSLSANTLLSVVEDALGALWIATVGSGLNRLDPRTRRVTRYRHDPRDPASLGSDHLQTLHLDRQGTLWIATCDAGLDALDPRTGRCVHYRHRPDDPTTLSDDVVLALHLDRDGILWLGTTAGLNRLDPRTGKATAYRQADGLPNDMIYSIVEDRQGYLWVGTNRGLARFDPRSLEGKCYTRADGLQDNEFNQGAAFASPDGKLYFGGIHGVNVFDPAEMHDNPFIPPIVLTAFELFHKPVPVGPESPLRRPIEVTREIRLTPSQTFFQVEYAALHYASPQDHQYAYKLEGLDPDWNYVGRRRFASYTNVPPGEYTLRVKGTNSDGVWNDIGASLKLVIPPHIWQTRWFRLLGLTGVGGRAYAAAALRLRTVEAQRQRLERQVDECTHELRETMTNWNARRWRPRRLTRPRARSWRT